MLKSKTEITEEANHPISLRLRLSLRRALTRHLDVFAVSRSDFLRAAILEKMRRDRMKSRQT